MGIGAAAGDRRILEDRGWSSDAVKAVGGERTAGRNMPPSGEYRHY